MLKEEYPAHDLEYDCRLVVLINKYFLMDSACTKKINAA